MSRYVPRTTKTRWIADQVIADLRLHPGSTHAEVSRRMGLTPYATLSMFQTLDRHGILNRWRVDTSAVWRWELGPKAPAAVDLADLEELLGGQQS